MSAVLQAKFTQLLSDASALLDAGNLEASKAKREEALVVKAQIEEWRQIANLQDEASKMAPQRPALPGTTTTTENLIVQDSGPTKSVETPDDRTIHAAYVNRFGDPESEIKGIMVDLHGDQYAAKYWAQRIAYNKYLRHGEAAINGEERALLKTIVFTPESVKTALAQGVDSVGSLKTTMVEAADSLGGYTVPVDSQSRIITRIAGKTLVRGKAKQQNTSRDKVEFPKMRDNGNDTTDRYTTPVRVRWVSETPKSLEAQNLTFGMTGIETHTSMAEAFLSRNLLEDTAFNVESYLEDGFAEAAAFDEDDQFLFGDGVGKPLGILPGHANTQGLYEVTSGTTSSPFITWDKLIAVPYEIPRQYRTTASWMFNRRTVRSIRQLRDPNTNQYLWEPFQYVGGQGGQPAQLLDYPVNEHETFNDLANGAYFGLYGDLAGYQIIDRVGMTVERFVDSYTARLNLVCFVMRRRLGGRLLENWRMVALRVAA
jgi:HK97 family phage major capsid protein